MGCLEGFRETKTRQSVKDLNGCTNLMSLADNQDWVLCDGVSVTSRREPTFPVDDQGFDQSVELPELLVCRLHLLQLILKPLQQQYKLLVQPQPQGP